jgi:hypothetical protein
MASESLCKPVVPAEKARFSGYRVDKGLGPYQQLFGTDCVIDFEIEGHWKHSQHGINPVVYLPAFFELKGLQNICQGSLG